MVEGLGGGKWAPKSPPPPSTQSSPRRVAVPHCTLDSFGDGRLAHPCRLVHPVSSAEGQVGGGRGVLHQCSGGTV